MSDIQTERYLEDMQVRLDEACQENDWNEARTIVEEVEVYGFDASYLRREMNAYMAKAGEVEIDEPDDFSGASYLEGTNNER